MVKNALGRLVPTEVNGRPAVPFAGLGKHRPTGRKACPPGLSQSAGMQPQATASSMVLSARLTTGASTIFDPTVTTPRP